MRKLMALAIVLVVTGVSRSYALIGLGDLSFDGSLEFGGYSAKNEVDRNDDAATSDHRGEVVTRQRLGINGDVTESAKFRVELGRNAGQFGKSVNGTSADSDLQQEQENIHFYNLYLDLVNFYGGVSARLGRQYVGNPGDLAWNIAAADDNNMSISAIDGLLLQHRHSFVHTDLFFGKLSENDDRGGTNTVDTSTGSDTNLSSLDFVFPSLVPGARLNLGYLWGVQENTAATSDSNKLKTYRLGINGGAMENRFTYRAEYFMNDGENKATMVKYEGAALDLGVGFNIAEGPGGNWGFNANILVASGDDDVSDDKDESFHDFSALGFNTSDRLIGDIFGKSNTLGASFGRNAPLGQGIDTGWMDTSAGQQGAGLQVLNLGASWGPSLCPRSIFSLNWYTFNTVEDGLTSATGGRDGKIGSEIDFAWNFRHSDNVNAQLGYAVFSPDEFLTGTGPDDNITQFSARLAVKWGGGGGMTQIDPQ